MPTPRIASLGRIVAETRRRRRMTQQSLADAAEMSLRHVKALEHGDRACRLDVLDRLATALGISPWRLLRLAQQRANGELEEVTP